MSNLPPDHSPLERQPWGQPWPVLAVALALAASAWVAYLLTAHGTNPPRQILDPVRALLLVASLVVAGCGVRLALRRLPVDLDARLEAASAVAVASLVPLVGYFAAPDWDSLRMLDTALIVAAVGGALLLLLPSVGRRIALSLLVLVHFGGILVAVTSVEPPNQPAPWLSGQLWGRFYRPYLGFMYLNNAYHFYSPEPGPPTLMWSYLVYSDGKDQAGRWVKLPDRENSPVPLHHQRMLALTESINNINTQVSEFKGNEKLGERQHAAEALRIPLHSAIPPGRQYQEPNLYSQMMISAYARHLCRLYPTLTDRPDYKIKSVKIYRVIHNILEPLSMANGFSPLDKTLYFPYYQGEYDPEGELVNPKDPFLYWLIPILRENRATAPPPADDPDQGLNDYLEVHARLSLNRPAGEKPAGN